MLLKNKENKNFVVVINDTSDIDKLLNFLTANNLYCYWASGAIFDKDSILEKMKFSINLYFYYISINLYFYYIEECNSFEVMFETGILNARIAKEAGVNYYTVDEFLKGENNHMMFTKKDLKNGMVVETRAGNRYCVCGDKFIGFTGWIAPTGLNNFLECESSSDCTIDKVYNEIYHLEDMRDEKSLKLLWEREVPKEMTVAEIEKELGYPIKIVKEYKYEEL